MTKLIIFTLWSDLKKTSLEQIRINFFIAAYCVFWWAMHLLNIWGSIDNSASLSVWGVIRREFTKDLSQITAFFFVLLVLYLVIMFYKMPLRLPRALYVCAADEQTKLRYLKRCMLAKMLCCIPLTVVFFLAARFFEGPASTLILASLLIPFLVNLCLRSDPGNRKLAELEDPSIKTERSPIVVFHIYWFCGMLLELLTFFTAYCLHARWSPAWITGWILAFILNFYLAVRSVPAVLRHLLDYEKIYYPLKEEEKHP